MSDPILITGYTGFIGRKLTAKLEEQGQPWLGVSRSKGFDWREPHALEEFEPVSCVVHLAGAVGVISGWDDPETCYEANMIPLLRTLELCRARKIPLVLLSSYIYGMPEYLPIDEKHPISPQSPYARSKRIGEMIAESYATDFGVSVAILRVFNIYGPNQSNDRIVARILNQINQSDSLEVSTTKPARDYLYIDDLISAITTVVSKGITGYEYFNIGFGKSWTVLDIIQALEKLTNRSFDLKVENKQLRQNDIPDCVCDCEKFKQAYNWKPTISLEEGLKKLLETCS